MWCKHCRQEVPGIASTPDRRLGCARCGAEVADTRTAPRVATRTLDKGAWTEPNERNVDQPPSLKTFDDREIDEQLRVVERLLSGSSKDAATSYASDGVYRFDPAQGASPKRIRAGALSSPSIPIRESKSVGSTTAWSMLTVGLGSFMCGAALCGVGWVADRLELLRFGVPGVVIGQMAIVAGLVLFLDQIWDENRRLAERIERVADQLEPVRSPASVG